MTPKKSRKRRFPPHELYALEDLEQMKVLADPLRIRILEAFCEERTTKQVAELLGEKPTRLYHHVDALERVGLVALSRTRPNRGTVEKYYVAVARTFRADSRLFQPKKKRANDKHAAIRQMLSTIFDTTSAELAALAERGDDAAKAIEEEAIVSFLDIRASQAQLEEIRTRLHEIIRSLTATAEVAAENDEEKRYRLTLAYYPLEGIKDGPRRKG